MALYITCDKSQMGSTKLLFVAGGVSVVALLVGLITNQIFRPVTFTTNEPTEPTYEADDQLTLSLEPPTHDEKGELGELRTEVALKDQAQDLQDLDGDPLAESPSVMKMVVPFFCSSNSRISRITAFRDHH